eukprot:4832557-Amphidinium_carterae.1
MISRLLSAAKDFWSLHAAKSLRLLELEHVPCKDSLRAEVGVNSDRHHEMRMVVESFTIRAL